MKDFLEMAFHLTGASAFTLMFFSVLNEIRKEARRRKGR